MQSIFKKLNPNKQTKKLPQWWNISLETTNYGGVSISLLPISPIKDEHRCLLGATYSLTSRAEVRLDSHVAAPNVSQKVILGPGQQSD